MGDATALTVFLVRHGAHGLLGRTLCGRMPDVSLGQDGRDQAIAAARRLAREPAAAVLSSPLERAVETAEPIAAALGIGVHIADELNEIDCGEWTGCSFDALHGDERWHLWNRERASGCPPGGEPMAAVQGRVAKALDDWRGCYPDGSIVAVSHADVIKAAICHVLGLSLDRYHALEIDPGSVSTLVLWEGGGKLVSLNVTAWQVDETASVPPDVRTAA